MNKEEIQKLITRKETEIKQLMELQELVSSKHLEKQIDIRLDDLSKLHKELKEKN